MIVLGEEFSIRLKHLVSVIGALVLLTIIGFVIVSAGALIGEGMSDILFTVYFLLVIPVNAYLILKFGGLFKVREPENLGAAYLLVSLLFTVIPSVFILISDIEISTNPFSHLVGTVQSTILIYMFMLAFEGMNVSRLKIISLRSLSTAVFTFLIMLIVDILLGNTVTSGYESIFNYFILVFGFLYREKTGKLEKVLALAVIAGPLIRLDFIGLMASIIILANVYFYKEDKSWI